jgi:hypothetical protein
VGLFKVMMKSEVLATGSQSSTSLIDLASRYFVNDCPDALIPAMELGNYDVGQEWYRKAEDRGATRDAIDHELRVIFKRADKTKRAEIKAFLLGEDPVRYPTFTGTT